MTQLPQWPLMTSEIFSIVLKSKHSYKNGPTYFRSYQNGVHYCHFTAAATHHPTSATKLPERDDLDAVPDDPAAAAAVRTEQDGHLQPKSSPERTRSPESNTSSSFPSSTGTFLCNHMSP